MENGIASWVDHWAEFRPDKVLIQWDDERITWRAFGESVNRFANALGGLGVAKGVRVGVLMKNRPEFFQVYWAIVQRGAIFVPLNVHLAPTELAWIVNNAGIEVLVTDPGFDAVVAAVRDQVPVRHWISADGPLSGGSLSLADLVASASPERTPVDIALDDPLGIYYTSGTTGLPKGAVLTHGNILFTTLNHVIDVGLTGDDLFLQFLPLCFTGGILTSSMWIFHTGASMVLEREFNPGRVLQLIDERGITYIMTVPTMVKMLIDHPAFERAEWTSMREVQVGAAPVPEAMLEVLQAKGVSVTQGYGLTEGAGFNSSLGSQDSIRKLGSTGRGSMYCRVKVVNDAGEETAPGEVGELLLSGPQIMLGYWNNPEATADALEGGWLHTGDLVIRDEEGYIYVKDRKKEMIISGGLNVYPAEVESVLYRFDEIAECAVIGLPDEMWGERVTAVVVLKPGRELSGDDVIARTRAELAAYKTPKQVIFVEAMPKTVSGKFQKRALRDRLAGAAG
jgi:fatty-acyl-CoA synthase